MSTDTTTENEVTEEVFISPKDLANLWDTDPKSVRRFLRANTSNRAGKGGRWEISTADVETLTEAWNGKAQTKRFEMKADAPDLTEEGVELTDDDVTELEDELVDLEDIDDEV